MMAANKRNYRRITLKTIITATGIITPKNGRIRKSYKLPLEDLSASGLRYTSKFAIPLGTKLELVFAMQDRQVEATAEVVRSQRTPEGIYDIGCRFIGIDNLDRERIIKYVTLSSVRDSQPSSFYTLQSAKRTANVPLNCTDCRCVDCGDREVCRSCFKPNCGKRFCRLHWSGQQDLRVHRRST